MSNYVIEKYFINKARELELIIKVSKNKNETIDVYKDNIFLHSIGDIIIKIIRIIFDF